MGPGLFKECCLSEENRTTEKYDDLEQSSIYEKINDIPYSEINFSDNCLYIRKLSNLPISQKNVIRNIKGSPYDHYDILNKIGIGAYGQVYKIKHRFTNQIRAMKIISRSQIKKNYTNNDDSVENEIDILKEISHPNIIKLYEVYRDENNYYLIDEFCSEGELLKYLIEFKKFPEYIVKKIMYEIFTAVGYLHINGIIHGDLKLENIMIDCNTITNEEEDKYGRKSSSESFQEYLSLNSSNNDSENNDSCNSIEENIISNKNNNIISDSIIKENNNVIKKEEENQSPKNTLSHFDIKLLDFGHSKIFSPRIFKNLNDTIGTLFYVAPEVLKNSYNEKCDIWSCGVIMYILLSGELPFTGVTEDEIKKKILNGRFCFYKKFFNNISPEAKDLMRKCFTYDPKKRISFKEALNHPFFNHIEEEINDDDIEINEKTKNILINILNNSHKESKLFQSILVYLVYNFGDKKEISQLKKIFFNIDKDKDGKISFKELKQCYENYGIEINDNILMNIFNTIDFDNDDFIDYPEFLQATMNKENLFTEENLQTAFEIFDTNNDGNVSVNEIEEIIGITGKNKENKKLVDQLLKEINKNKEEEFFTYEEFKKFILEKNNYNNNVNNYVNNNVNNALNINDNNVNSNYIEDIKRNINGN